MSDGAEYLRQTARMMRETANDATPAPWAPIGNSVGHEVGHCTCAGQVANVGHERYCGVEGPVAEAHETDAALIAHADPAFVLAVTDWLEHAADALARGWAQPHALAVARAWRGESA